MMRSRRAWPLTVVCVGLAWSLMACGTREEAPRKVEVPPQTPVEPSVGEVGGVDKASEAPSAADKKAVEPFEGAIALKEPLSEVDVNEATKLKDNMRRALFPWSERMEPANARRFLHLAAQDDNPEVIAAALQAMSQCWTSNPKDDKRMLVDEDYKAVVVARLRHPDKRVQGRAMEASGPAITGEKPDEALIDALATLALEHPEAPTRYSAVVAVARAANFQKREKVVQALLKALDAEETYLISTAILYMQFSAYSLPQRSVFRDKAEALMGHEDPGVRGRAVLFMANLARGVERRAAGDKIHEMLKDPHPYVRSTSASALAALGRLESIPRLMELLDDSERNTYTLKGFSKLTGEPGSVPHSGSAWFKVKDAALKSLELMTMAMGDVRFQYGPIKYKTADKDIDKAVKSARRWYRANKKTLDERVAKRQAAATTAPVSATEKAAGGQAGDEKKSQGERRP